MKKIILVILTTFLLISCKELSNKEIADHLISESLPNKLASQQFNNATFSRVELSNDNKIEVQIGAFNKYYVDIDKNLLKDLRGTKFPVLLNENNQRIIFAGDSIWSFAFEKDFQQLYEAVIANNTVTIKQYEPIWVFQESNSKVILKIADEKIPTALKGIVYSYKDGGLVLDSSFINDELTAPIADNKKLPINKIKDFKILSIGYFSN